MRHVADAGSGDDVGGQSHPANFNHANLALACATAREALLDRAAARLRVAIEQLTATDGVVTVASDASARITYGGLIDGQRFEIPLNPAARRKHPGTHPCLSAPRYGADHAQGGPRLVGRPNSTSPTCRSGRRSPFATTRLRFYPDEKFGYEYPESYLRTFGEDYKPEPYLEETYRMVRKHRLYMLRVWSRSMTCTHSTRTPRC